jgi:hypothetical protein
MILCKRPGGVTPRELQSFNTRGAALSLLFDLIRRNAEIDRHHLRIVCELAELPARTRAVLDVASGAKESTYADLLEMLNLA